MPRKPKTAPIVCEHFVWRLFRRDGVYYADGRGGHKLGKHSLGTRDREEALANLRALDRQKAVELGIASVVPPASESVSIEHGWTDFLSHCGRPQVLGGVSPGSLKRYRAVRDKHVTFCRQQRIAGWEQITRAHLERYGKHLHGKDYADRTIHLELVTVKSALDWLIGEKRVAETCRFRLSLSKPQGTDTYCYQPAEVHAMIERCRSQPALAWLADVILALACTGFRISELASLRTSDIDLASNTIRLTDERSSARRRKTGAVRTTKGRRSRTVPIHPLLRSVLEQMPQHSDGRLFHGPRGGKLKPDTVRRILIRDVLEPLKKRFPTPPGEIGFEHGRLHSFRHYFVSQAFLSGASEGEIQEWVGHQDSKMVAHYRHLRNEDSQRKMQRIQILGTMDAPDGPDPDPIVPPFVETEAAAASSTTGRT